jgi:hypothetical protein
MVARSGALSPGLDHTTLPAQWGGEVTHITACFARLATSAYFFLFFLSSCFSIRLYFL